MIIVKDASCNALLTQFLNLVFFCLRVRSDFLLHAKEKSRSIRNFILRDFLSHFTSFTSHLMKWNYAIVMNSNFLLTLDCTKCFKCLKISGINFYAKRYRDFVVHENRPPKKIQVNVIRIDYAMNFLRIIRIGDKKLDK